MKCVYSLYGTEPLQIIAFAQFVLKSDAGTNSGVFSNKTSGVLLYIRKRKVDVETENDTNNGSLSHSSAFISQNAQFGLSVNAIGPLDISVVRFNIVNTLGMMLQWLRYYLQLVTEMAYHRQDQHMLLAPYDSYYILLYVPTQNLA